MKNNLPKKAHFIGICGVATSALAIAMKKAGVSITGSDKGFYPPVSDELRKNGVDFYAGWHPEKISAGGLPEAVIVGTASGSNNPETAHIRQKGIKEYSFAKAIGEFIAKEKSIVCAGTWGKTSSSAMLSFILERSGFNPSYMFGGISLSHESSAKITDGDISVLEGDEYKSSPEDGTAKFFYYKPTHILLSAVSWDHADLYPTEDSYFNTFKKLIQDMPANGFVVAQSENDGVKKVLADYRGKIVTYGRKNADYIYYGLKQDENGLSFTIENEEKCFEVHSPMIGDFQAENITGAFAIAKEFGVPTDKILSAIKAFGGLKRRMEKRSVGNVAVFDDIAHSPEKAVSVIKNLREIYKGRIVVVFEPNIGARKMEIAHKYDGAFGLANEVIIPKLTKLKTREGSADLPIEGDALAKIISKTKKEVVYIPDDAELVKRIISGAQKGDCIAFLGAHGFRGMIEETVKLVSDK